MAISLGFRKIPVPIIVPTTMAAAANPPSPRISPGDSFVSEGSAMKSSRIFSKR
ncbi:MAG: hypothetical protein ACRD5R_18560 [Candidatus Acidiferrales bacterium]